MNGQTKADLSVPVFIFNVSRFSAPVSVPIKTACSSLCDLIMKIYYFIFILLLTSQWTFAWSKQSEQQTVQGPRIGLVLSGGGARGSAHIGVIKVLEQMRIPIHAIVGTSMGALVGGTYASGMNIKEIEKKVIAADWNRLFDDDPPRSKWPIRRKQFDYQPTMDFSIGRRNGEFKLPKGAIAGQNVHMFIADLVQHAEQINSFDQLMIPFRAIATNLENGQMHVFDRAPLADAMRASMSVPGLFSPIELENKLFVDGGLVRNLGIDVMRSMNVDHIIAINLGSSYLDKDQLGTVIGVAGQMIAILTEQNVQRSLQQIDPENDVLIVPKLGDISSSDFNRAAEAIKIGEQAATALTAQLARFSLPEQDYLAWKNGHSHNSAGSAKIKHVNIEGLDYVDNDLFKPFIKKHQTQLLNRETIESDISGIYGYGDFERLSYRVKNDGTETNLIINALEKAWGPGYLSFGLNLNSDFSGDSRFGINASYRQTWINNLGAEWLNFATLGNEPGFYSEFYQPLKLDRSIFIAPYFKINRTPLSVFRDDVRIARYDVGRLKTGIDIGSALNNNAEIRAGIFFGDSDFQLDTGSTSLQHGNNLDSGIRLSFIYDTLDSAYVPTKGSLFSLNYVQPLDALGAEVDYQKLEGSWYHANSYHDHTFVTSIRGGTTFGDEIPYYDQFTLGGFLKLSGYANEQFRANSMAFASLIYYNQLEKLTPPLGRGLYFGASLEAGYLDDFTTTHTTILQNSNDKDRYGASIFFGSDTWLGPFYVGWGVSADGESTAYVLLGQP